MQPDCGGVVFSTGPPQTKKTHTHSPVNVPLELSKHDALKKTQTHTGPSIQLCPPPKKTNKNKKTKTYPFTPAPHQACEVHFLALALAAAEGHHQRLLLEPAAIRFSVFGAELGGPVGLEVDGWV